MPGTKLAADAAATLVDLVRTVRDDRLGAPTPCAEFDVRALVSHLLYWAPPLEGAARKRPVPPPDGDERGQAGPGWAETLEERLVRSAEAWSVPAAWTGTTRFGPMELPAALVGGMFLTELLVHGWDLARATGRDSGWPPALVDFVYEEVVRTADQGRRLGVYGPEVPVAGSAPTLSRLVALTGRDPAWTP